MAGVRRFLADHKLAVSLATVGLVVVGGVAVASGPDASATVTAIVDGDTIDVLLDGEERRVRLLNVDTPEVGECLADEASAFLTERLPADTDVALEYDTERLDGHGRDLAGVFEDDSLVNAEIAREGLGVAMLVEPNDRFYDDVLEAQEEAELAGIGLFSTEISCTLPAQVHAYGEQVTHLEAQIGTGTLDEVDGWAAEAAAAAAVGASLAKLLDGDDSVFPLLAYTSSRWTLGEDVAAYNARVDDAGKAITAEREAEERRIEAEREAEERRIEAEREEAERVEREAAEEREREAAAEREREAAEQREREAAEQEQAERRAEERAAEQERQQSSSGSGSSGGSSGGGGAFKNCSAARAAGAAPVYAGQSGYGRHLDRDGDGVGCE